LNFGNPYNPEVYWQFVGAITGMGNACKKFGTPVTGGNVSFYNQSSDDNAVFPTPTIGMIGLMKTENRMTLDFKNEGDYIYILGETKNDINSSQYLSKIKGVEQSPCPAFDLQTEFDLQNVVKNIIAKKLVSSVHDISEGGLFVTLIESAKVRNVGFSIQTTEMSNLRLDAILFGETQSRVVVSVSKADVELFENTLKSTTTPYIQIGHVLSSKVLVNNVDLGTIEHFSHAYDTSIESIMN
jgi:phosphoribosylformylglycinamidine synthase